MSRLRDVPDSQLSETFRACHATIDAEILAGSTHPALASRIGISESALKQFLRRGRATGSEAQRRGSAFERIFQYTEGKATSGPQPFSSNLTNEIDYDSDEYRKARKNGYELILHMLAADSFLIDRYGKKLEGFYLCFRYSAIRNHLMISRLEIRKNDDNNWDFVHVHYDKFGELKEADGLFIPKNNSIYLIGDLEKGAAIDILLFKEPISSTFSYIAGIEMSVDNDFRPFTARVLAFRCDSLNVGDDYTSNDFIKKHCKAVRLDKFSDTDLFRSESKNIYKEILDRLKIDSEERIIRIEPR